MKTFFIVFFASALAAFAGITGTNLFSFSSYTAGTNYSNTFVAPQAHTLNPISTTLYHSATNYPGTNILQVTFDGGQTWANVATYTGSTNANNDVWNISYTSLTPSNRVVWITSSNQTLYGAANWNQ
jgi:hypothetical protein